MTQTVDAPVSTIEYDCVDSGPLQQIPTKVLKALWVLVSLAILIVVP
ncbi:MAG: hypothetical protein JWM40_1944, partial [Frankiales bacterium]|nr:hypothetical protein [Frankiales bacterium]